MLVFSAGYAAINGNCYYLHLSKILLILPGFCFGGRKEYFLMYPCAVQTGAKAKATHPFLVTLSSLDLTFLSSKMICLDVPWVPQMDMSKMEFVTLNPKLILPPVPDHHLVTHTRNLGLFLAFLSHYPNPSIP